MVKPMPQGAAGDEGNLAGQADRAGRVGRAGRAVGRHARLWPTPYNGPVGEGPEPTHGGSGKVWPGHGHAGGGRT